MTTRQILRTIIATGLGVIIAVLVIMAIEAIGHRLAPFPPQVDPMNPDMAKVPVVAMLAVVLAWFLGTLAGGSLGNRLAHCRWPGWVIAGLVLVGAIYQFTIITHPAWMMAAGVAAPLLAAWILSRWAPEPPAAT
jgi:hypothetical protein